ncbi:cell division protein SepF [Candidatus Margulisiibacteriota bacterium]
MTENLIKRARAFIGLEEDLEEENGNVGQQLDMNSILRGKKESKGDSIYEIFFYEPKVYEDSLNISTHLRSGNPVIINLKHLDPSEGTRLIDFVCGTAYAIDGHMIKIGDSIFLFAPRNISVTSSEDRSSFGEGMDFGESGGRETFFSR